MWTSLLLTFIFHISFSSIRLNSWSATIDSLPTDSSTEDAISAIWYDSNGDPYLHVLETNHHYYKKFGVSASWKDIKGDMVTQDQNDLECRGARCSTTINNRWLYMHLYNTNKIYKYDMVNQELPFSYHHISVPSAHVVGLCLTSDSSSYLYLVGNGNLHIYSIQTSSWSTKTGMPYPATKGGCAYYSDSVYYFGGVTTQRQLDYVQIFDIGDDEWKVNQTAKLPVNVSSTRAVTAPDGLIYVIGGWINGDYSQSVVRYNPMTNTADVAWRVQKKTTNNVVEIVGHRIVNCGFTWSINQYSTGHSKGCVQSNELITSAPTEHPTKTPTDTTSAPTSFTPGPTRSPVVTDAPTLAPTPSTEQVRATSEFTLDNPMVIGVIAGGLVVAVVFYCICKKGSDANVIQQPPPLPPVPQGYQYGNSYGNVGLVNQVQLTQHIEPVQAQPHTIVMVAQHPGQTGHHEAPPPYQQAPPSYDIASAPPYDQDPLMKHTEEGNVTNQ
eukprot:94260_1